MSANDEGVDSGIGLRRDGFRRGVGGGAVAGKWGVSLCRCGEVCARIAVGRQIGAVAALSGARCVWKHEDGGDGVEVESRSGTVDV